MYSKNFMSAAKVQQIMTIGHINIKDCMRQLLFISLRNFWALMQHLTLHLYSIVCTYLIETYQLLCLIEFSARLVITNHFGQLTAKVNLRCSLYSSHKHLVNKMHTSIKRYKQNENVIFQHSHAKNDTITNDRSTLTYFS